MFSSRRQRQRIILAALAVIGILLGAFSYGVRLLDSSLQAVTYDTFITNAPGKLSNQITIVALDDKTVAKYGKYPAPTRPPTARSATTRSRCRSSPCARPPPASRR